MNLAIFKLNILGTYQLDVIKHLKPLKLNAFLLFRKYSYILLFLKKGFFTLHIGQQILQKREPHLPFKCFLCRKESQLQKKQMTSQKK